jgi:hypothetical protein
MGAIGDDPLLRLGVAMVLLAPCTDWYVTFTHLVLVSGANVLMSSESRKARIQCQAFHLAEGDHCPWWEMVAPLALAYP